MSENKFHQYVPKTFYQRNCIKRFFQPYYFGYIATLGVIDEFRKYGIARTLVNKSVELMKKKDKCVGVFLHVIEHNNAAIKFYSKLNFFKGPLLLDHYALDDAYFNSFVYYKILRNNELFSAEIPFNLMSNF
jgi:ribosomal protein S18 acetylase RimI-like enzyme